MSEKILSKAIKPLKFVKRFTQEEVEKASTEYFKEKLPADVFIGKYALRDGDGKLAEATPDSVHDRMAHEFARIDAEKYGMDFDARYAIYFDAMKNFARVVPQGSPMSAIGNPFQVMSASNCVVVESPKDSIAGIMETGTELAQLYKRRAGVGCDLSTLRPDGFRVNNAARTTSGAWSFADFFSYITRMIGQCLDGDTLVLTQDGLKKMKDITEGEKVWTKNSWVEVEAVIKNIKPTVKVTTDYGREIICSKEHVFDTIEGEKRVEEMAANHPITSIVGEGWKGRTINLKVSDYQISTCNNSNRLNKDVTLPAELDEKLAYILGYAYGDGHVGKTRLKTSNIDKYALSMCTANSWPEIREKLASYIKDTFNYNAFINTRKDEECADIGIYSRLITDHLHNNGLLKQKAHELIFPEVLLGAKSEVVFAFISGFADADGDIQIKKKGYRIRSVCKSFILVLQNILSAFGIPSRINVESRSTKGWKDLYTLSINGMKGQHQLHELMKESVKFTSCEPFSKVRDFCRTVYTTADFGTRASKHSYVIDDKQFISYTTSDRLLADTSNNLKPRLIQDYVEKIEPHSENQTVYDLKLKSEHLFFANGLYAHNSGRRGALMITLSVHHPDIIKFATMKADLKKVTGANVSIRLTDDFLNAVDKDDTYEQYWPLEGKKEFSQYVKARDVWNVIIEMATKTAEPGLIFWDRMTKYLPAHSYKQFRSRSTNPCCFAEDSQVKVIVKTGMKNLTDIKNGDEIWIDSAKVWAKTSGYFKFGKAETSTVKFSNGVSFDVTNNHKFECYDDRKMYELNQFVAGSRISCSVNAPTEIGCGDELKEPNQFVTITEISKNGVKEVGCIMIPEHHKFTANGIISGNSEICLSAYDSCRLITLNATGYVTNAFTSKAAFDFDLFVSDIQLAVQMCDNLVDLELELIEKIKSVCDGDAEKNLWQKLWQAGHDGRRTGLGTHGLADALAQLNIKYDSDEALEMVDMIYSTLRNTAYDSSIELAKSRGPFPAWDWDVDKDNAFIQDLPKPIRDRIQKFGRRNISQLTQAPTGSVSILSKCGEFDRYNVSSGVEPVFRNFYIRRKKINPNEKGRIDFKDELGDCWQEYPVFHPNVKNYLEKVRGYKLSVSDEDLDDETIAKLKSEKLPSYFTTSDQISWEYRVKLQGVEQKYLDHSISSTINLPKGTSTETVGKIYLDGWKNGLKGVTVYVAESRQGVLITDDNKSEKLDSSGRPVTITKSLAPKRPKALPCEINHATVDGKRWTVMIGIFNNKPYEMFLGYSDHLSLPNKYKTGQLVKHGKGKYALHAGEGDDEFVIKDVISVFNNPEAAWTTRLISLSLRHGIPIEYVTEQLSKEGKLNDINRVLARVLKKYIPEGEKVTISIKCSNKLSDGSICNSSDLIYQEGCASCRSCGYTKCN